MHCVTFCSCETCCLLQESSASVVTETEAAVMESHVCQFRSFCIACKLTTITVTNYNLANSCSL